MSASEAEPVEGDTRGRRHSVSTTLVVLGVAAALLGAHHSPDHTRPVPVTEPTMPPVNLLAGHGAPLTPDWTPARSFRLVAGPTWGRMAGLDSASRITLLKLNRMDLRHANRRSLVVPDSLGQELDYAPFPDQLPALTTIPTFIAVSRRVQAFGAYHYGVLVRWGPVSTGKTSTPTDTGLFFTNWKKRRTVSTENPAWILNWYVNIIGDKGVAFHQYELPGEPASHGCVRLLEEDARWIYGWTRDWQPGRGSDVIRYGTPVLIFGNYDPEAPAPWTDLPASASGASVSAGELDSALAPHLATVVERSH
jgi:L,D-transpeptidase catalytic domain